MHLHFTPTYSSWLNQVELWFAKIERDVIARGISTSVKDLARKLMRYIRHDNAAPKPVKWKYSDPAVASLLLLRLLQATRAMRRAHLRRYGALDRRLHVQKVRLAGCLRRRAQLDPSASL